MVLFARILSIVTLFLYLKASNKYQDIQGHVSVLSAKDFIEKHERFVLFLRGFESDVYNTKDIGKCDFYEDKLSRVINKGLGISMCAVGMTKEADSPIGCERVYVEDSTWEDDVYELMQNAEKIIIRVNNRTSCLWEINRSKGFMQKCSIVADDLLKYNNALIALSPEIVLPAIPKAYLDDVPLEYDPRSYFFSSDMQMKAFQGEISDYCEMVCLERESVTAEYIKDDRKTPFYEKPFFMFLMVWGVLLAIFKLVKLFG